MTTSHPPRPRSAGRRPAAARLGHWPLGLLVCLLAACSALQPPPTLTPAAPTATLATPDPLGTAQTFLSAWERGDYAGMYSLLSPLSQDAVAPADFQARYLDLAGTAAVTAIQTQTFNTLKSGTNASVLFEVTVRSALFGEITRRITMPLVYTGGGWAVAWTDGLILPEMAGGGTLSVQASFPARGNIYDRNGLGLAVQGEAVAIGVQPGLIQDEAALLAAVAPLLGQSPEALRAKYADARPDWYVPLGEANANDVQAHLAALNQLPGLILRNYPTRFYPLGGAAPQVVGYLGAVPPERLAEYQALGYTGDERVGQAGLEAWGEAYLAGSRGGTLSVVFPDGRAVPLAERQRQPAQAITTTLDRDLQLAVQQALAGFRGAIIILDPATGAVLAMASSPTFDPNLFDPTNPNSAQLAEVLADPDNRLLNRATQSAYPPGSVFKIPVMGAAMLSGLYTRETVVNCGNVWNGLGPSALKYNWTYGTNIKPPGKITLVQALQTSCNPYFYTIALDLDGFNPDFLPQVARQFGLGAFTQVGQVAEAPGLVPDPAWKQSTYADAWRPGDSVNMGIGQGYVLVTPLQVAEMIAAVRNGGTLYRPQLVQKIAPPGGEPTYTFQPIVNGQLPLAADQLQAIREGLHAVTSEPGGTARHRFLNLGIPVAGKTGTAQNNAGLPHSWFAGYTEAEQPDRPDIAGVVIVENGGEGSDVAAPLFRRIVELYFLGRPATLLPWETDFGVAGGLTPASSVTPTPTPAP
ncbi:MAG: hypothetical protein JNK29_15205 [Anaerolineales bacterium]|nr:hypothetical protein [Anaerolineales bacterium]